MANYILAMQVTEMILLTHASHGWAPDVSLDYFLQHFSLLCSSEQSVTVFSYISLSRQLHFQVCHTARSKFLKDFSRLFGGKTSRIYIWRVWSSSLVASINGTAHKRIILRVSSIFLALLLAGLHPSVYVIISLHCIQKQFLYFYI